MGSEWVYLIIPKLETEERTNHFCEPIHYSWRFVEDVLLITVRGLGNAFGGKDLHTKSRYCRCTSSISEEEEKESLVFRTRNRFLCLQHSFVIKCPYHTIHVFTRKDEHIHKHTYLHPGILYQRIRDAGTNQQVIEFSWY